LVGADLDLTGWAKVKDDKKKGINIVNCLCKSNQIILKKHLRALFEWLKQNVETCLIASSPTAAFNMPNIFLFPQNETKRSEGGAAEWLFFLLLEHA
jgi:hypothetical protein